MSRPRDLLMRSRMGVNFAPTETITAEGERATDFTILNTFDCGVTLL